MDRRVDMAAKSKAQHGWVNSPRWREAVHELDNASKWLRPPESKKR